MRPVARATSASPACASSTRRIGALVAAGESIAAADLEFHRELARIADNPLFLVVLDSIVDLLFDVRQATLLLPEAPELAHTLHGKSSKPWPIGTRRAPVLRCGITSTSSSISGCDRMPRSSPPPARRAVRCRRLRERAADALPRDGRAFRGVGDRGLFGLFPRPRGSPHHRRPLLCGRVRSAVSFAASTSHTWRAAMRPSRGSSTSPSATRRGTRFRPRRPRCAWTGAKTRSPCPSRPAPDGGSRFRTGAAASRARSDGMVTYEMDGTAGAGLPLRPDRPLRPASRVALRRVPLSSDRRGRRVRRGSSRGTSSLSRSWTACTFPPPGPSANSRWTSPSGVTAYFAFEGDHFELEDQRNWTDAAFKSYSTPLSRGLTHDAVRGHALRQRVTVRCMTTAARPATSRRTPARRRSRRAARAHRRRLPVDRRRLPRAAGVGSGRECDSPLPLDHHRIDLDLTALPVDPSLDRLRPALSARVPLEVALTLTEATAGRAPRAARAPRQAPLARMLVFEADAEVASAAIVARCGRCGECAPGVAVGGGH